MRPTLLDPLFAPVTVLDGIGDKSARALAGLLPVSDSLDVPRVAALLFHLPHAVIDRSHRPTIVEAATGRIVTLAVRVDRHQPSPRGVNRVPYRVFCHDATGEIALTFFHARGPYLERLLPVGETVVVSGRVEWFNGRPSMVHPDHVVPLAREAELPRIEPVYAMVAGVSGKMLRRAVGDALTRLPQFPEWIEHSILQHHGFPALPAALERLHNPQEAVDADLDTPARRRLAYDELLAGQLALALLRASHRKSAGVPMVGDGSVSERVRAAFRWPLTGAQERSLAEIKADMAKPERMLRLLQGDVGSGKTIVAMLCMAIAAESGRQSALMAPTEVLARQHFNALSPLAEAAGLRIALLTGRDKGRERDGILRDLSAGEIDILVGTHALFQPDVSFADLGLAIVDEQHRFGVHQRLMLSDKGRATDMLVMTATPIPRTLVLTAYGDMDVSRLDEKPANRKPILTNAVSLDRLPAVIERIRAALDEGKKAYWVCPLVEDSEDVALVSAQARFEALGKALNQPIGLVHGQMKNADKDAAMAAFRDGDTRLLVATTVIEVGVDVPDATIMVIEHAERFGLAQLHQLRGRVGRGDAQSTCLLLFKEPLGDVAAARIAIMRETNDGFRIAEEDLKLRGEGEILGTRQSGTPGFRLARLEAHGDLLEVARKDTTRIMETDPALTMPRGEALRVLLYLHERDAAIRLLGAG